MGISSLLPLLSPSTEECHIRQFKGRRVAVDAYCWLHRGSIGCALQLARGQPTTMYSTFFMKYVNMLLNFGVKPVMVFDGRHLPAKSDTERKRAEVKRQARAEAEEYFQTGAVNKAFKSYIKCVEITPQMALTVIQECRKIGVDCIVAPYESDSQLAFLSMQNYVDCVVSEDSDLLIFGCKKVLYKMDITGRGMLIDVANLNNSLKMYNNSFSHEKFRYMCILAGCDYLDSLPGIGVKKALKFVKMTVETDPLKFLDKLPSYINMRHLMVDEDYKKKFLVANATFLHQIIYNPFERKLQPLNPVTEYGDYCQCAGELFDAKLAFEMAIGNINPLTLERMDNWSPKLNVTNSIWAQAPAVTVVQPTIAQPKIANGTPRNRVETEDAEDSDADTIQVYLNLPEAVEESSGSQTTEAIIEDRPESPIISRNPFLKNLKKQTSSVPVVNSPSQSEVTSVEGSGELVETNKERTVSGMSRGSEVKTVASRFFAPRQEVVEVVGAAKREMITIEEVIEGPDFKEMCTYQVVEMASFYNGTRNLADYDFFLTCPHLMEPECVLQVQQVSFPNSGRPRSKQSAKGTNGIPAPKRIKLNGRQPRIYEMFANMNKK